MKRRLSALLMAIVMLIGLWGCGGNAKKDDNTDKKTTTTTTATGGSSTTTTATTTTTTAADASTDASSDTSDTSDTSTTTTTTTTAPKVAAKLGGVSLSEYTIVYDRDRLDYTTRAANYIQREILSRTGADLTVIDDNEAQTAHEIVVGETSRSISKSLNQKTEGLQFSMIAKDGHVAMEGDYFIIAAAAYYFVNTYITGENASTTVPSAARVLEPIQETPNNYIFLIGDGMGEYHTKLPEVYDATKMDEVGDGSVQNYTDGETLFYGYLLPYMGFAATREVNGNVTDSAASATALATGYKTSNGRIGKDKDKNDLLSLTELAGSLGMATAVMSTEARYGATPAGFSAHADDRSLSDEIKADQQALTEQYGTIIKCNYDKYTHSGVSTIEWNINSVLKKLETDEDGFFLMYEEAYIDKHSHNQDLDKTAWAVFRFNQAIAFFMEFAFYNPDTFVLITADHETGALYPLADTYYYGSNNHSAANVPIFTYGKGAEVFDGQTIENVQIPKTIAKMWGEQLAADTDDLYPPLP